MRLCVYWNGSAGRAGSLEAITSAIESAGHCVSRVVERPHRLLSSYFDECDCAVAAGGDGTVATVARALFGRSTPMAIVPVGTANNVASSLGIVGTPGELIARWSLDNTRRLNVGTTGCASVFLESAGGGLAVQCMAADDLGAPTNEPKAQLVNARQLYIDRLQEQPARPYRLVLDGETIDGDYLLVEVLNTPRFGPGVTLAHDVRVDDGLFSIVTLGESDRCALHRYLAQLRDDKEPAPPFSARLAKSVTIYTDDDVHVDDAVVAGRSQPLRVTHAPGSIRILVTGAIDLSGNTTNVL